MVKRYWGFSSSQLFKIGRCVFQCYSEGNVQWQGYLQSRTGFNSYGVVSVKSGRLSRVSPTSGRVPEILLLKLYFFALEGLEARRNALLNKNNHQRCLNCFSQNTSVPKVVIQKVFFKGLYKEHRGWGTVYIIAPSQTVTVHISILKALRSLALRDLFKLTQNFLKSFDHETHSSPQSIYNYFIALEGNWVEGGRAGQKEQGLRNKNIEV